MGAAKSRTAAEADYDASADALIVRVADAYFNVLTAIETLASSRAEERSVKRQLDQAEKRLEVGLAPITDVHEARARYDSARANAILQATVLDDAYEALSEITGQRLTNLKGLSADFRPENPDTKSVEEWVAIALLQSACATELHCCGGEGLSTALAVTINRIGDGQSDDASWDQLAAFPLPRHSAMGVQMSSYGDLSVPCSRFATHSRVRHSLHQRTAPPTSSISKTRDHRTTGEPTATSSRPGRGQARRLAVVQRILPRGR